MLTLLLYLINLNYNNQNVIDKTISFREERKWKQFHTLKDLLLGLNIEVAELQELFLWKNEEEQSFVDKEKISEELADIFIFLTYISEHFGIDLEDAVLDKIEKNSKKYPIEKCYGRNKKYNNLD